MCCVKHALPTTAELAESCTHMESKDELGAVKPMEIDDSLYSRQRYVLGDSAMHRMAKSNVFLSGLGGLGVEIAKNIVLAGVKSVTLHDPAPASLSDLSSQFFLREEDVRSGTARAVACCGRIAELNPYVTVRVSVDRLELDADLSFLKEFQCVVLTDASRLLQGKVDKFCRSQVPPIRFLCAEVRGVFSYVFCDFGNEFEVVDPDGEEPAEAYIEKITKGNPGVVKVQDRHGFDTGDVVKFKEVSGMVSLNGTTHKVKVKSPSEFTIGDISGGDYQPHTHGGIVQQVKVPKCVHFEELESQLSHPDFILTDLAKPESSPQIHVSFQALHLFVERHGRLPGVRHRKDAEMMCDLAQKFAASMSPPVEVDSTTVMQLAFTAQGLLPPLASAIGGIVAQEALIALTGKFSPLKQWLFSDAREVLSGQDQLPPDTFLPIGDRYDAVRVCLGSALMEKLANQKLFMVGCGAIGCEMLKNYAVLGIGAGASGKLTITDNDIIEKSNLNRQFLFRPHHMQQPKSVIAAASTRDINPGLKIDAQEYKVGPQTSSTVYNDDFFQSLDVVVNALDNIETRRYMDSRCVSGQRPLLESGTMGTKGHVQVVVPHLTESYSSQQDPPERDVPYCTLKSFPATIEHTIQWARDKFESLFAQKPDMFTKFWETSGPPLKVIEMSRSSPPENMVKSVKILSTRPTDWSECVALARVKFEKYYNHKARNLLHAFPEDHKLKNGSPFWQTPKRPPRPLIFDPKDDLHLSFVLSMARLYADVCSIQYTQEDMTIERLLTIFPTVKVPPFRPSSKTIITDESVQKSAVKASTNQMAGDAVERSFSTLSQLVGSGPISSEQLVMQALSFEKDDDENGHIDFITAASNLRAQMYSIETADRYKTKRIAGRIVPAIATTTAAVAGLATIELIKIVMATPLEAYKNAFMNLALPLLMFSEPAPPQKTVLAGGFSYTLWDKWEIRGHPEFKLSEFMEKVKEMYRLTPSMVVSGVKMVYVPVMPSHKKRLTQSMMKLLKVAQNVEYVDLTVSFINPDGGDDIAGPPVRYHLQ